MATWSAPTKPAILGNRCTYYRLDDFLGLGADLVTEVSAQFVDGFSRQLLYLNPHLRRMYRTIDTADNVFSMAYLGIHHPFGG